MSLRISVVVLSLAVALADPAKADDLPRLQRGDVIFQNSRSAQSLAILLATDSPFTHVGIIDFDETGTPIVLEAVRTTRATPLEDWITFGEGNDIAIYRMEGLTEDQALSVTETARSHFGKGYDPYFYKTEDRLYCSELVHIAFRDGMGVRLGNEETLADLNLDSDAARALIAERWQSHPACADGQADSAKACMGLILNEPLVTPQAVAGDHRLRLIYTSFQP
jgi:Permuted papain-like amidase enzyme, YaeF/YiiX, C92 family